VAARDPERYPGAVTFVPDVGANLPDTQRVANDLRAALKELKVAFKEDAKREVQAEFTPSPSYEAIKLRMHFPGGRALLGLEGHVCDVAGEQHEELRAALNYLNLELGQFRYYVGDQPGGGLAVFVRHDLLPTTEKGAAVAARELRQALTSLCQQKAIFAEPLRRVQAGDSWKSIQSALKSLK
jgi:hypothetical protein